MPRTFALARRHLDNRLRPFRPLVNQPRPPRGYIRAIRDALGMSSGELAARLGIRQPSIIDLERSEELGTIKLDTLRRVADALGCDLAYALVPRTSLDDMVRAQALRKATSHLAGVAHHMRLEDQAVGPDDTRAQLVEVADHYLDRRGLWTETTNES